jgi:hypothetical protein
LAEATINLNSKQRRFCNSEARFPAFVGGWGCGKTMCGILRGMLLSESFRNNLGMIVRKKFTDLRDSTLKDFERYTGLAVKKDSKEVTLSNGSVVMFRHGDELSGLQNVNLGWFMIEQAEEFETAEQFDLLRGRMRRQEAGIRQGMIIANTAGHNWVWDRWKNRQLEDYELTEANIDDCREHLPQDVLKDWERLRIESPKKYNRYVLNSWEDYDLEGAFYASLMSDALKENRIGVQNLHCRDQKVFTFWDLGVRASDTTAIWCVQFIDKHIHVIDYYENYGEGMDHYARWLNEKKYNYGGDYLPHDAKNRLMGVTIQTREEILRDLRPCPVNIIEPHRIEDRIETTRAILPKCYFDENCKVGVNCLNHYKKKKNEVLSTDERPVFANEPLHDWASNGSDAFGYMAVAHKYMSFQGQRFGQTQQQYPVPENYSPYKQNILTRSVIRRTA